MMYEINDQSFDMRTIMILISHNHDVSVPELAYIIIFLPYLKPYYFQEIRDFRIFHDLFDRCISDIQKFSSQGKDAVFVSTDDFDSCES